MFVYLCNLLPFGNCQKRGNEMVTNGVKRNENLCPVSAVLELIGGKWKPVILYCIRTETRRFGEISARIPAISRKVLTEQLKELERDGLVYREQFNEIPPRVEYTITERGRSLSAVLNEMEKWGLEHLASGR
jgi:DNA-binding HxlR family transcriptional regulator